MRDLALVLGGMLLGWSAEGSYWRVQPQLVASWKWLRTRSRRDPRQWFKPSDRPQGAAPTTPRPQPGARPVRGQRAAQGAHRAVQRQVRFGGRTFRRRTKAG